MRVAIGLALAVGLCVGCGGPPEGVCPATSAATAGQLVVRGGTREFPIAARFDCAGSRELTCIARTPTASFTIYVPWPLTNTAIVDAFDIATNRNFTARAKMGDVTTAVGSPSEIPDRREARVSGLICDNGEGEYVGADMDGVRLLLPAGL